MFLFRARTYGEFVSAFDLFTEVGRGHLIAVAASIKVGPLRAAHRLPVAVSASGSGVWVSSTPASTDFALLLPECNYSRVQNDTGVCAGKREQRMRRTRVSLITAARRLTVKGGLAGFTVEQLCAEVGISRRTFFNYFASKDDAVLGTPARDPLEAFGEQFVASGAPGGPGLLAGLQELVVQSFRVMEGPHDRSLMLEVIQREPALLRRLTESMEHHVTELAKLIARRQGCAAEDPFPRVAAAVIAHLVGHTVQEFLAIRPVADAEDPDAPMPIEKFTALLTRNLELATTLFMSACDPVNHHRPEGKP